MRVGSLFENQSNKKEALKEIEENIKTLREFKF
jgi:hypothetical protein